MAQLASPLNILIADDHQLMREAVGQLVRRTYENAKFVMAGNFSEVMVGLQLQTAHAILLDLRMPGMRGLESVAQIVQAAKGAPVIVWTGMEGADMAGRLSATGVYATVSKAARGETLMQTLEAALQAVIEAQNTPKKGAAPADSTGEIEHFDIEKPDFLSSQSRSQWPADSEKRKSTLTERQIDILRCLHEGMPNKVIARKLDISLGTVKNHVNALFLRLHTNNRSELLSRTKEWVL